MEGVNVCFGYLPVVHLAEKHREDLLRLLSTAITPYSQFFADALKAHPVHGKVVDGSVEFDSTIALLARLGTHPLNCAFLSLPVVVDPRPVIQTAPIVWVDDEMGCRLALCRVAAIVGHVSSSPTDGAKACYLALHLLLVRRLRYQAQVKVGQSVYDGMVYHDVVALHKCVCEDKKQEEYGEI